ncbi:MAG: RNA polymerase sigma-54 factor, partial [Candidatus Aminicenantes bacterium]|nr:RNA polymerase sigma-54 factor [Candidatus Aminicenantes bacterium]
MELKQQLHQKQVQRLILAPALQQAIKLLPLTNLEIIEIIDTELSQNPMLEVEEETAQEKPVEKEKDSEETESSSEAAKADMAGEGEDNALEDKEFEAYFHEYFDDGFRSLSFEKKEAPLLENIISKSQSLWDHLDWQANLTFFEEDEKEIAQNIIGNINEDGYLIISVEEISESLGASLEKIEKVRAQILMFDPVGVGSLSVKECFLAQMAYFGIEDDITIKIVAEYLFLLEKSDFARLSRELGISLAKIKTHIDVIKGLSPAPGRKFSQEKTAYIVPDILVTKEDGELKITLNDEGVSRLRINSFYKTLLSQASQENAEARSFLKDKMKKAFWFLRSLD